MAFELDFVRDPVTDRVMISCHDVEEGDHTLAAGERIRVQIGPPGDPVTLMNETVPAGTAWTNIHFQFQAQEDSI